MKQRAYRKELTNALKLWQKSGYTADSRQIIRVRAASRVSAKHLSQTALARNDLPEYQGPSRGQAASGLL